MNPILNPDLDPGSRALLDAAFENAPIGMALVGFDGRLMRANRVLGTLVDRDPVALRETALRMLIHPQDVVAALAPLSVLAVGELAACQSEARLVAGDGEVRWTLLSTALVRDGDGRPACFVVHAQDITERKAQEERLRHRTMHDPLTGLPNRTLFADRAARALAGARGSGESSAALLMLDLDGFKAVNDGLGHEAGDRLLIAISQRLATCLRSADVAARFGGDEFALLIERTRGYGDAAAVAERVLIALRVPIWLDGREISISASIGVACAGSAATVADLVREADAALYRAKAVGPGAYVVANGRVPVQAVGIHPIRTSGRPAMTAWPPGASLIGNERASETQPHG